MLLMLRHQRRIFPANSKNISNVSIPTLPIIPNSELIRLTSLKPLKKKSKKILLGGGGGGSKGSGSDSVSGGFVSSITNNNNTGNDSYADNSYINLFTIYGNILKSSKKLIFPQSKRETDFNYPIDENLMKLFDNSSKFWYESDSRAAPSILSINAPSRRFTWELTKSLVAGKSNLAIIPISMFHDLLQTCTTNNNGSNNDFLLKNKKRINDSRPIIQVIEYLFSCLEESIGSTSTAEGQKFTLMIDGLEELLQSRREDFAIKDLIGWTSLFEPIGRKIIFGGRSQNQILNEDHENFEDKERNNDEGEEEDDYSKSNGSSNNIITFGGNKPTSSTPNGNNLSSPFQVITDFFIKASGSKSKNDQTFSNSSFSSQTNVRIDGPILRLIATGPKTDKRKLLKYSQVLGLDRKKDLFDSNISFLTSMLSSKWKLNPSFGLDSKHDFPSDYSKIWDQLSGSGRGILMNRKLSKDEFNEIIMYLLGESNQCIGGGIKPTFDIFNISDAIENVSKIRQDPTKFSSNDLINLLSDKQIPIGALSKYEKRFINCISTSTTETKFQDISLPGETIKTLKSLTTLPLTHPELFTQGILKNSLTGVLLFGPPGTGKTMLARAIAQESGATFLAVNMSNIFDMWVGEGEKNVKGLFNLARKLSPSIIFIDEIDALLERRSSISGRSSRIEIVNEFMSQWDGLSSNLNSGVIVIGATNRPFVLDDAVLRRLPRRLLIDLPDQKDRQDIILNLLKDNLCETELIESIPEISRRMEFYSGSDLKNVAITAALKSATRLASFTSSSESPPVMIISKKDFEESISEVPASLSDQMDSLIELRKWNLIYGETKFTGQAQKKFGFA